MATVCIMNGIQMIMRLKEPRNILAIPHLISFLSPFCLSYPPYTQLALDHIYTRLAGLPLVSCCYASTPSATPPQTMSSLWQDAMQEMALDWIPLNEVCIYVCKFVCVGACMSSRACEAVHSTTLETPYAALKEIKSDDVFVFHVPSAQVLSIEAGESWCVVLLCCPALSVHSLAAVACVCVQVSCHVSYCVVCTMTVCLYMCMYAHTHTFQDI